MPKVLLNVRENLIDQGRLSLIKSGYTNFNIRDISKTCNIGIGTFYNYFSNKDSLVIEIITDDWNKVIELSNSLIYKDIHIKEKLFLIYSEMDIFLSKYLDTFNIMVSNGMNGYHGNSVFEPIYSALDKMLSTASEKKEINPSINLNKLSKLIIGSISLIIRQKEISFDEMYSSINM